MCDVPCTRPTIWILDQYLRKQDGVHLLGIQMVGLAGIHMAFKNQTIWHLASLGPFEYRTSSIFRSPLHSTWFGNKNLKFFQVKNICVRREDTASDCVSAALKVLDLSDLRTGKNLFTVTNHMDISSTGLYSGAPKSNPSKSGIIRN